MSEQEQGPSLPRPVKVTMFSPMFAVPPEENGEGGYDLRFIVNPMEHIVVSIPAEVAVALREGLPSVAIAKPPPPQIVVPR